MHSVHVELCYIEHLFTCVRYDTMEYSWPFCSMGSITQPATWTCQKKIVNEKNWFGNACWSDNTFKVEAENIQRDGGHVIQKAGK